MADPSSAVPGRIAYLVSQYPATSHTFISREVAALRGAGVQVDTFSVRLPSPAEIGDKSMAGQASSTFTVLDQPATRFISAQLVTMATQPVAYLQTLALALRHRPPGLGGLVLSLAHFAEAAVLARELKRQKITRLHNHFANSGATVGLLASKLQPMPWSFTMHGISETDYPAGMLLGRKIAAADFVACVSYFARAQAMRLVAPDHWAKLHVVRCGLDFSALPARPRSDSAVRVICVGRLSPEKGQTGLIEAFRPLAGDNSGLELMIVGDGPELKRLKALATRLGVADRVRFAGRLGERDALQQIAAADILVLPSFMEGLPIVLMEAMAMGTAVIASRVAGIPELIEDGKSGLLFTPSDWIELEACLRRVAGDDRLRKRLAAGGRKAVKDRFNIERSANQLRDLFGAKAKS
jgi:glycosyltransferase involved in cell wall biosynthesis